MNEDFEKKNFGFLLNNDVFEKKHLKKTIVFTKQTIVLNERYYCAIVQWEIEQSRCKMNDNLENEKKYSFS